MFDKGFYAEIIGASGRSEVWICGRASGKEVGGAGRVEVGGSWVLRDAGLNAFDR